MIFEISRVNFVISRVNLKDGVIFYIINRLIANILPGAYSLWPGALAIPAAMYKAEILNTPEKLFYLGSTARRFIERYHTHKGSFQHRNSKNHT